MKLIQFVTNTSALHKSLLFQSSTQANVNISRPVSGGEMEYIEQLIAYTR